MFSKVKPFLFKCGSGVKALVAGALGYASLAAANAYAAVDSQVSTELTTLKTDIGTLGALVIGVVLAAVLIYWTIRMVKKS